MVKKNQHYTKTQLAFALDSVLNGMSLNQASKKFQIPKTTLRNKRDGKYVTETRGIQPVFHKEEEEQIVKWVHYLETTGFPITRSQISETVNALILNSNRRHPFKNGVPGKKWFRGFFKRNPIIDKSLAKVLPRSDRASGNQIQVWFHRVYQYFKDQNLCQTFCDPKKIFNCDEIALYLRPKEKRVLCRRYNKRVLNRVDNEENECVTIVVSASANGDVVPPLMLQPHKKVPESGTLDNLGVAHTESGWMNMEVFFDYITNTFYPWLLENEIEPPVVVFLDGYTTYISLPLLAFCKEKGIELVALLPNSNHVLHPIDVAIFQPLKELWSEVSQEIINKNNHENLTQTDLASEVMKCLNTCINEETIRNGFEYCGMFPFHPNNFDYNKLIRK